MKILRVRRGYTTNSSSASQYVPPSNLKPTSPPPLQPTSPPAPSAQPAAPVTVASVPAQEPQPQPSSEVSNTMLIGGLAAAVAALFALERIGRMIFRAWRKPTDDE